MIKDVITDDGGDALPDDFGISINGVEVVSGSSTLVAANTSHTINELGLDGYEFVSITGDDKCPSELGGSVTLDEGEGITCTITNDDIAPAITLYKEVDNSNGGTKLPTDFTLLLDGSAVVQGTAVSVTANEAHSINESDDVFGYEFVSIAGSEECPELLELLLSTKAIILAAP